MNLLPVLRLEVVTVLGDKGQQGVELQILHLPNDLLADMAKGLRLLLHGHACGFENILDVFGLKFHHDLPLGLERFGTDGRAQEGAHDAYQAGEYMIWADELTYKCLADATVHGPDVLPGSWEVIER